MRGWVRSRLKFDEEPNCIDVRGYAYNDNPTAVWVIGDMFHMKFMSCPEGTNNFQLFLLQALRFHKVDRFANMFHVLN